MDSIAHRYLVPGDVMLALAITVNQSFEALRLAALAARDGDGNGDAMIAPLQYLHGRLSLLHESLLAIVDEQRTPLEVPHGSA